MKKTNNKQQLKDSLKQLQRMSKLNNEVLQAIGDTEQLTNAAAALINEQIMLNVISMEEAIIKDAETAFNFLTNPHFNLN